MTDTTVTTEAPNQTPAPLPNDQAARSTTGEIIDQGKPLATTTPTPDPKSNTEPTLDKDGKPVVKDPATKPPEPGKIPEKYEFKAPEGYTVDPKVVDAATPIFKELGLTQEQGQKLFDFYTAQQIEAAKAPQEAVTTMRNGWKAQVSADPDLAKAVNGDKTGLDAVKLDIGRALTHLDPALSTEFKQAMDLTGAGDHPAFVKAIWKLSQLVTEGKHVVGGNPSPLGQKAPGAGDRPSAAKSMFPNLPG